MIVNPDVKFRLSLGDDVLRCPDNRFADKSGIKETPYVCKLPDEEILDEIKDASSWSKFKAFVKSNDKKKFIETYRKSIKKMHETGNDTVQFVLTNQGLEIGKNYVTKDKVPNSDQCKLRETKLCCANSSIDQRSQDVIRWVDEKHKQWFDPMSNKFVLRHHEDHLDKFFIEMPYGDRRPRLTTNLRTFTYSSQIICSAKLNLTQEQ